MRPVRGRMAMPEAWLISISRKSTSSSSPRSGPFCARLWLSYCIAIFCRTTTSWERAMPLPTADKRAAFRKLHESGCFVIPNPFDVGTAKALQHLGFKAIASTSAGFAWAIGKADNRVTVDLVCDHLAAISEAVDIPVNADFEDGFAVKPEDVAVNVARAVKSGVAGLSIEDYTGDKDKPLFEANLAVERIKAARAAIDKDKSGVLLTGRCEAILRGVNDL